MHTVVLQKLTPEQQRGLIAHILPVSRARMNTLPRSNQVEIVASRLPKFSLQSSLLSLLVQITVLLVLMFVSLSQLDSSFKEIVLLVEFSSPLSNESDLTILTTIENKVPSIDSSSLRAKQMAEKSSLTTSSASPFSTLPTIDVSELVVDTPIDTPIAMRESSAESAPSSSSSSKSSDNDNDASLASALDGRKSENKAGLLLKYGGSAESEAAVERALMWIANHQADDGGWTFAHDQVCRSQCGNPGHFASSRNGATAMALLPFLGAGQTHREGQHKDVVNRGIDYLLAHQQQTTGSRPTGSWYEPGGTMYSHCLASIAICEAYAMTADSRLQDPAQLSLNFLVQTQDRSGGGWRYEPKQAGDTSVVGWAVMALKSGKMGALEVPATTLKGVNRFLSSVSSNSGSNFGYVNERMRMDGGRPTTAIGLLCRMYQGAPRTNSPVGRGARQLAVEGPRLQNLYGTYYTAQVLRHLGGQQWDDWNKAMRDPLIELQVKVGHASGSWQPNSFPDMGGPTGGRLYATSMSAMILEVYYRHMPLYSEQAIEGDLE